MGDDRAHLGLVVERVADLERLDLRDELLEQRVVDPRPRDDARTGGAVLAGVPVAGEPDSLGDRLRVGVVEDHHRRLASELEVDALERVRRVLRDQLAGGDVAGQRDEAHVRVRDDALARGHPVAGDDAEDAGGDDLLRELDEPEERERRLLRGLQDLHVAGGEGGSHLPDRHHQRVVPRADAADDAERLAPDDRRVAGDVLARRLALEMPRGAREEAEVVGRERHLVARGHERLADVARLELRQLLGILLEDVRELVQQLRALLRRRVQPGRQGLLRRLDRAVDVVGAAARHLGDRLAGGRVDHLHRLAGGGIDELPADEGFVGVDGDAHVPSYLATTAVEAPRRRTPVSRMSRCARSTGIAVRRIITNAMTFTTGSCWPSRM